MSADTMRAILIHEIGGPAVLKLQQVPKPAPRTGQVRIRVKAFGLNRSEVFTRQGHSPGVTFPRILGIEAAGVIDEAPDSDFHPGDVVVTAMGGMGRSFDGGYAEYTVVPASQVRRVNTTAAFGAGHPVRWELLGALPELMQTAWGSLYTSLQLQAGDNLLIRGGTTGVGLAAAALAKAKGVQVTATTRKQERVPALQALGIEDVIIDNGSIAAEVQKRAPFSKILELVGVTTLEDSLKCASPGGTVCMTGVAGNKWSFDQFTPFASIPSSVRLTTYAGNAEALLQTPIEEITRDLVDGKMQLPIKTFPMDEIVEAHRLMEEDGALAKVVMLI
ncbi:zinc-binding alcohol dehydrogenase family protein [Aspergillus clavatus NRRL 1]|uniref:Zinc-binding oxidoreductase, putative n=1 Tax=Aspergillus clavatus (strain ATCC 1007 / CBS 513.65 / DSM 816 / NCTC 3887 / NRRL 1 / QM 1276 / 107) TaxID=344612 RepID=A1CN01_ASPCL|nr:zinc-binding oxidoreductase, putative [Aspergillus clavatus NRRL 1]EAW08938.1 zinc-binding oxidoreductase, putative [Aspergillus clavatus NRRL 1]